VELIWKGPEELRALPAELVAVEKAPEPRWRLRRVGPANRGQRRAAVRTPITLSVQIAKSGLALSGVTIDLSEGGMKCVLERPQRPASDGAGRSGRAESGNTGEAVKADAAADFGSGDVVAVSASLGGSAFTCQAEVVRRHHREDARTELSLRFIGLSEFQQDVIRRHVFATLRDLRLRGLV
jgi:c-di-GMP-binding flagellar brake protein YcgR